MSLLYLLALSLTLLAARGFAAPDSARKGKDSLPKYTWSGWSKCSGGVQVRTRECFTRNCPELSLEQRRPCICGDGGWTNWCIWSPCVCSSGNRGYRTRRRSCTNPHPSPCGKPCKGPSVQMQSCIPIVKGWSSWEPWSICFGGDCWDRYRSRIRSCTNPRSSPGCKPCRGTSVETQRCLSFCAFGGGKGGPRPRARRSADLE